MKEQLLSELKELTENVSDTYDDFVYGINWFESLVSE